jgi:sulfite reductase beta subunit-like hemoprotein
MERWFIRYEKLFVLLVAMVLIVAFREYSRRRGRRDVTLLIDNTTPTTGIEAVAKVIEEKLGIALEDQRSAPAAPRARTWSGRAWPPAKWPICAISTPARFCPR